MNAMQFCTFMCALWALAACLAVSPIATSFCVVVAFAWGCLAAGLAFYDSLNGRDQ